MTKFIPGDVDGGQILTDNDHLYPRHINEARQSRGASVVVGRTEQCEYYCDGEDDDVQIQEANESLTSGGLIHIKNGTYNINSAISGVSGRGIYLKDGVCVEGEGKSTILNSTVILPNTGAHGQFSIKGTKDIFIKDIFFKGASDQIAQGMNTGLAVLIWQDGVVASSNIRVSNCDFVDGNSGVGMIGTTSHGGLEVKDIMVSDCNFTNYQHPITVLLASDININNIICRKSATGFVQRGLGIWHSQNVNVNNYITYDTSSNGLYIRTEEYSSETKNININNFQAFGSLGYGCQIEAKTVALHDINLSNCHFEKTGISSHGIFFNVSVDYLLHNVNIANSYIYGGNSGIRNSGEYSSGATRGIIQDIVFENCNIIGTFYGAALVKGSRVTFRNCHLVQTNATTGYDAGYFEDLDYLTLENCTFESADNVNRRDLAVINCTNVNIKNCTAVNSRVIFTGSSGNWLNNIGMGTHNNRTTEIPNISSGTAAPSTTPIKVGNIFVDTVNNKIYISDGTTSSGNWKILN